MDLPKFKSLDDDERIVALSGRDLQDAERLLRHLTGTHGRSSDLSTVVIQEATDRERLISFARQALHERRRRMEGFGAGFGGEPAWALLLIIYIGGGGPPTIGHLADLAAVPLTSALRWLEYLEDQGLVVRSRHPNDARKTFIEITDRGREKMDRHFSEVIAQKS